MSFSSFLLTIAAWSLQSRQHQPPRSDCTDPRILVIRRNRLGDMIYTLPLLHALRRNFPHASITVACDPPGAPIAQACAAVNEVVVLKPGWSRWSAVWKNAARLQGHDWIIAAKGGFDRRLARLTLLTNGARRIGFENKSDAPSSYYTDPVALPENPHEEHQIETLLRLLTPLNVPSTSEPINLSLRLPNSARQFAATLLAKPPFSTTPRFMLINLSSTVLLKFNEEDFIALIERILKTTDLAIGLVGALADQPRAHALASRLASDRITAVATSGPLELAALLDHTAFLLTPEGGAAHLAATVNAPALVLWSEGPFDKWRSRGPNHAFVHAQPEERTIPVDRVWQELQSYLTLPAR